MLFILKSLFPTRPFSLTSAYISHSLLDISRSTSSLNLVYPPKFTDQSLVPVLPSHPNQNTESHFYHPISSHCTSHPVSLQVLLTLTDENFTTSPLLPVALASASSLLTLLLSLHVCTNHSSPLSQTHHSPRF